MLIVVLGTLANDPWAGMAWMHMQITAGLRRLGHDAWYFETTSAWPYDPIRGARVRSSDYALPYLASVCERFDLAERWAYRRSWSDKEWFGLSASRAEAILTDADLVLNVSGATRLAEEGYRPRRLVYLGTDPLVHEIGYANGDPDVVSLVEEHDDVVTYGENIGTRRCPVPPLPNQRATTRQPVLLDFWDPVPASREAFTTVGNWRQEGRDLEFAGETYRWSKHHEFMKLLDLPAGAAYPLELGLGLESLPGEERHLLESNGWRLADAHGFTRDPFDYREYIRESRGEFTVAKGMNVRLASGWFSERSACYLAAGRPVVTQDTGFGDVLPVGAGLFAFRTAREARDSLEAIRSDWPAHSAAAREVAVEYFDSDRVLGRLLDAL